MAINKIPKVIHQTYSSIDETHHSIKSVISDLKNLNPDWEYRFYDDQACKEYISKNYDVDILKLYSSINPSFQAAKADLFRYLLIYKEGGLYLDIKSTCIKPLSEIITPDDEILLSYWPYVNGIHPELRNIADSEIPQWYIAAMPGSPFIRAVIDTVLYNLRSYNPWSYGIGKLGVLRTTGPIAYTLTIYPLLEKHPNTFKSSPEEYGFLYTGLNEIDEHEKILRNHYSKHNYSVIKIKNTKQRLNYLLFYTATIPIQIYRAFKRLLPSSIKARLKKYKIFWYL